MLKKIQKEVENLRVKVYAGQSLEDTEKALYEIEQMLFKAMDEQLNIHSVVNSDSDQLCGYCSLPLQEGVNLDYCKNDYCTRND